MSRLAIAIFRVAEFLRTRSFGSPVLVTLDAERFSCFWVSSQLWQLWGYAGSLSVQPARCTA
jgi:hypothetical protein